MSQFRSNKKLSLQLSATETGNKVRVPSRIWIKTTELRGLCALYVLLSHIWYQVWPAAAPPWGYRRLPSGNMHYLTGIFYNGHFAVVAFIVLSGYSLGVAAYSRGTDFDICNFAYRRCRRILPPYYAASILSAIIAIFVINKNTDSQWDISIPVTLKNMISHALLLQDFTDQTRINYAHWSVATEFHLYLLLPCMFLMIERAGALRSTVYTASATVILMVLVAALGGKDIASYIGFILYFFLGAVIARITVRQKFEISPDCAKATRVTSIVLVASAYITPTISGVEVTDKYLFILDATIAISCCAWLLALPSTPPKRISSSGQRFMTLVSTWLHQSGKFSYSLYLVHAPIIAIVWVGLGGAALPEKVMFMLLIPIGGIASLTFSYGFYKLFEEPYLSH